MSRRSDYLDYIVDGGVMSELPLPVAPEDNGLYKMAVGGFGLEKSRGFYRCKVHNFSDGDWDFVGSFIDLGANVSNSVKVKATITMRKAADTALPKNLGIRLFANNTPEKEVVLGGFSSMNTPTDYLAAQQSSTTPLADGQTYELEATFSNGNLATYRYLKPFIVISKLARPDKTIIDIHDLTVEVGDIVYDIRDSIFNFQEGVDSDFRYMRSEIPTGSIERIKSPFFNKKLACLGDSITNGQDPTDPAGAKVISFPWRVQLRDKCGFLNVKNYGANGRMISAVRPGDPNTVSFIEMVKTMDTNVDMVTVLGGINDFASGLPLGEFKAVKPEGADGYGVTTFYGAVQTLYEALKGKYTDIPIVVINMLNGNNGTAGTGGQAGTGAIGGAEKIGVTVQEGMGLYREAIRVCARHYGFPILELQDVVGFDVFVETDKTTYIPDGLHPNQAGHNLMAEKIADFINKLA